MIGLRYVTSLALSALAGLGLVGCGQDEGSKSAPEAKPAAQAEPIPYGLPDAEFLVQNARRTGVTTLPSGLQYEVIAEGNGATPGPTDVVRTHYHGTLVDGTVFDSSVERGAPINFPVNGVISGWTEALQLMQVGDKWRLFLPADLAYGNRGAGALIGPGATLVFEVELLAVNPG